MMLHPNVYEYLKPTDNQIALMAAAREATKQYSLFIENNVPDGADKTYILRKLRELGMWINVAITRETDGSPRV